LISCLLFSLSSSIWLTRVSFRLKSPRDISTFVIPLEVTPKREDVGGPVDIPTSNSLHCCSLLGKVRFNKALALLQVLLEPRDEAPLACRQRPELRGCSDPKWTAPQGREGEQRGGKEPYALTVQHPKMWRPEAQLGRRGAFLSWKSRAPSQSISREGREGALRSSSGEREALLRKFQEKREPGTEVSTKEDQCLDESMLHRQSAARPHEGPHRPLEVCLL